MTSAETAAEAASIQADSKQASIAASALDEALPCPLCGYDLRGLPAGRCPECGHGFDPARLREARRTRHPFLFEHHPQRPIRSFVRTLLAGWRPKRFWTRLRPGMEIVPRRLKQYAAIVLGTALLSSGAVMLSEVATRTRRHLDTRENWRAYFADQSLTARERQLVQAQLVRINQQAPMPTSSAFWQNFPWLRSFRRAIPLVSLTLFWPFATLASLLVFRRTIRQARIGFGHVARVIIYSGDVFAFMIPVLVLMSALAAAEWLLVREAVYAAPYPVNRLFLMLPGVDDVAFASAVLLLLVAGWRLWRAHRLYLAFPHAAATVLASQVIVWLALVAFGGPILDLIYPYDMRGW